MVMQITPKASCHHFADGESWRSIPKPLLGGAAFRGGVSCTADHAHPF
jgi:hypothetical protein